MIAVNPYINIAHLREALSSDDFTDAKFNKEAKTRFSEHLDSLLCLPITRPQYLSRAQVVTKTYESCSSNLMFLNRNIYRGEEPEASELSYLSPAGQAFIAKLDKRRRGEIEELREGTSTDSVTELKKLHTAKGQPKLLLAGTSEDGLAGAADWAMRNYDALNRELGINAVYVNFPGLPMEELLERPELEIYEREFNRTLVEFLPLDSFEEFKAYFGGDGGAPGTTRGHISFWHQVTQRNPIAIKKKDESASLLLLKRKAEKFKITGLEEEELDIAKLARFNALKHLESRLASEIHSLSLLPGEGKGGLLDSIISKLISTKDLVAKALASMASEDPEGKILPLEKIRAEDEILEKVGNEIEKMSKDGNVLIIGSIDDTKDHNDDGLRASLEARGLDGIALALENQKTYSHKDKYLNRDLQAHASPATISIAEAIASHELYEDRIKVLEPVQKEPEEDGKKSKLLSLFRPDGELAAAIKDCKGNAATGKDEGEYSDEFLDEFSYGLSEPAFDAVVTTREII